MDVPLGCYAKVLSAPVGLQREGVDDGRVVLVAVPNDKGDQDVGLAFTDIFAASEAGCTSTVRTTTTPHAV
eukprot:2871543-Lingulodinium_polyedra.AAC.1